MIAGEQEGDDWFQLTVAEEEVFAIESRRWPRMLTAWEFYEDLIDIVDPNHFDQVMIEAERKKWQALRSGVTDVRVFMDCAVSRVGLTEKEAHAIFYKIEFWQVRNGLMFGEEKQK